MDGDMEQFPTCDRGASPPDYRNSTNNSMNVAYIIKCPKCGMTILEKCKHGTVLYESYPHYCGPRSKEEGDG